MRIESNLKAVRTITALEAMLDQFDEEAATAVDLLTDGMSPMKMAMFLHQRLENSANLISIRYCAVDNFITSSSQRSIFGQFSLGVAPKLIARLVLIEKRIDLINAECYVRDGARRLHVIRILKSRP